MWILMDLGALNRKKNKKRQQDAGATRNKPHVYLEATIRLGYRFVKKHLVACQTSFKMSPFWGRGLVPEDRKRCGRRQAEGMQTGLCKRCRARSAWWLRGL